MSEHFRTPEDYELFLYTLADHFASIRSSTLTLIRLGTSLARVAGELTFNHEIRLVVRERLLYDRLPITIDGYGYEVWRGDEKLYWYDAQPHRGWGRIHTPFSPNSVSWYANPRLYYPVILNNQHAIAQG